MDLDHPSGRFGEAVLGLKAHFAGVAQLVEQLICNQQVTGSSPVASTTVPDGSRWKSETLGGMPEWPKGTGCKPVGVRLRWFESTRPHHFMRE